MHLTHTHRLIATVACVALSAAPSACGSDEDDGATSAATTEDPGTAASGTTAGEQSSTTSLATSAPPTTADAPATSGTVTPLTVDDGWRDEAAAVCAAWMADGNAPLPDPADGIVEYVDFFRQQRERLPSAEAVNFPESLRTSPTDLPDLLRRQEQRLAAAEAAAAAGELDAAITSIDYYIALLQHVGALVTVAGVDCADPQRAANAALNVPVFGVSQVATGFGSVWASPQNYGTYYVRVDPESGDVLANIEVGPTPIRAQPADGRMIVRTADAYVAIDPATNTVAATLPKADVGPAANRAWAVDGALWICDGQRLHRYDPATFQPAGVVIELGIDCGNVTATSDLVVAWNYNEDEGESGTSAAVFVDPATNAVLATTSLPADATVPLVLNDAVYFPANLGTTNAVVDRSTWTVVATPDYGREIGSGPASDGRSLYLIADGTDVLVVDARTHELTDVIEPLTVGDHLNALAVGPGALWIATGDAGILQRFDIS